MLLRHRLLFLFVAVLAGVLLLGAATAVVIRMRDDALRSERAVGVAVERVALVGTAYADQETGERGFVLTGEDSFLAPYMSGSTAAAKLTAELRSAFPSGPIARALDGITAAAAAWRTNAAEPEIALRRTLGAPAAIAAIATGAGKVSFDTIRDRLAALVSVVNRETLRTQHHLDDVRDRLTALLVAVVAGAAVGTLAAAYSIRRWVTRPIDALSMSIGRIRTGSLDAPIEPVGPPELVSLALDVDAMRSRIRQQLTESERSRTAVEQSAAVVLAIRAQLEPTLGNLPDGWTVAGALRAARGIVAGDCYDLFQVGRSELGVVVIDIAGHGAVEGILALRCKEILRTSLAGGEEPGQAIDTVSEQLGELGPETFLTAFVAVVNTGSGVLRYANAGHSPGLVVSESASAELMPTGPIVGPLGRGWRTESRILPGGDMMCVYTDGVVEVRSGDRDFFGTDRLVELIRGARCEQAPAVVKRCLDEIELFAPDGLQDDATIVVLCRNET